MAIQWPRRLTALPPAAAGGDRRPPHWSFALGAAGLLALTAPWPSYPQPPEPAAVGRDVPLTSTWLCENERSVLLNAHPRRPAEEAWLTYAGTRVAVTRTHGAAGIEFASSDGKVHWLERGNEATLQVEGMLRESLACRRQDPPRR